MERQSRRLETDDAPTSPEVTRELGAEALESASVESIYEKRRPVSHLLT